MVKDIILVGIREFEDDKCDIIHKYKLEEVRSLKEKKEIPENLEENTEDGKYEEIV